MPQYCWSTAWETYRIKSQLLIAFLGLTTGTLVVVLSILLGYIALLNEDLKDTSEQALVNQAEDNVLIAGVYEMI